MPWRCPVCGALNDDDAEVCAVCGAPRPVEASAEGPSEPRAGAAGEQGAGEPQAGGEQQAAGVEEAAAPAGEAPPSGSGGAPAAGEAAPENLYLEIVETPARELIGRKVPLMFNVFPRITVGRSPESVIVIPDPTVSRRHAVIERRDGKVVLRDLGSTNGTYVYDEETGGFNKVEEVELRPGMLLRLGESTIIRVVAE